MEEHFERFWNYNDSIFTEAKIENPRLRLVVCCLSRLKARKIRAWIGSCFNKHFHKLIFCATRKEIDFKSFFCFCIFLLKRMSKRISKKVELWIENNIGKCLKCLGCICLRCFRQFWFELEVGTLVELVVFARTACRKFYHCSPVMHQCCEHRFFQSLIRRWQLIRKSLRLPLLLLLLLLLFQLFCCSCCCCRHYRRHCRRRCCCCSCCCNWAKHSCYKLSWSL